MACRTTLWAQRNSLDFSFTFSARAMVGHEEVEPRFAPPQMNSQNLSQPIVMLKHITRIDWFPLLVIVPAALHVFEAWQL